MLEDLSFEGHCHVRESAEKGSLISSCRYQTVIPRRLERK